MPGGLSLQLSMLDSMLIGATDRVFFKALEASQSHGATVPLSLDVPAQQSNM